MDLLTLVTEAVEAEWPGAVVEEPDSWHVTAAWTDGPCILAHLTVEERVSGFGWRADGCTYRPRAHREDSTYTEVRREQGNALLAILCSRIALLRSWAEGDRVMVPLDDVLEALEGKPYFKSARDYLAAKFGKEGENDGD